MAYWPMDAAHVREDLEVLGFLREAMDERASGGDPNARLIFQVVTAFIAELETAQRRAANA